MAARYLLDTNICIYIRQNHPAKVRERFRDMRPGEAAISIVTLGELIYGAHKSQHRAKALEQLASVAGLLQVEQMTEDCATVYGAVRADLEKRGQMIGSNDLWIAAHALAKGLTLITNNEREFRRVRDLKIENWTQ